MNQHLLRVASIITVCSAAVLGCSSGGSVAPATESARIDSATAARSAIATFRGDAKASPFFETAYGYAVFPKITKGALALGVSDGRGEVFRGGELVGYAQATSVTIGAQVGGQTFSEIIFFEDAAAFGRFTSGQFTGQASAAAVAGKSGGSDMANYNHGVAVFTSNNNGLIAAAAIGGQKFSYTAK